MNANTPYEIYGLFSEYFNSGTIDLLLTLYTDDAVLIPVAGQEARGKEAIREALNGFLSLKGSFQIEPPTVVEANDTALVMAKWTLNGTSPTGEPVEIVGQTSDVIRRQPEGSWLFVIDNPFGAQSA